MPLHCCCWGHISIRGCKPALQLCGGQWGCFLQHNHAFFHGNVRKTMNLFSTHFTCSFAVQEHFQRTVCIWNSKIHPFVLCTLQCSCYLLAEGWSVQTCPLQKGGLCTVFFLPSASGCPCQDEVCTVGERLAIRDCQDFPVDTHGAWVKHPKLSQVPLKTRELFVHSAVIILKHDSQLIEKECTLEDEVRVSDQE